ncbi:unnamed protein product [Phytophthora fragariaefolia]|uniref:Unnamed protein product n=1 Tax=Phytophthora fragariaefolia TaxID=1490495 RepID=A0A9W6TQE1_9STRA|nr:unnamed protein product [Phytophthora fragariaefolia]
MFLSKIAVGRTSCPEQVLGLPRFKPATGTRQQQHKWFVVLLSNRKGKQSEHISTLHTIEALSSGKIKLDRALQIKDRCDRELQVICESKQRRYRNLSTFDGHDELILLEQDKTNENMIRDRRELERLMRKLSPAMSHFASTQTEFVHILQGCSICSNRLAFCAACTEKASEFFNGFTSAELFALYGSDLPPANETELANFVAAVAVREARAIRNECADT